MICLTTQMIEKTFNNAEKQFNKGSTYIESNENVSQKGERKLYHNFSNMVLSAIIIFRHNLFVEQ